MSSTNPLDRLMSDLAKNFSRIPTQEFAPKPTASQYQKMLLTMIEDVGLDLTEAESTQVLAAAFNLLWTRLCIKMTFQMQVPHMETEGSTTIREIKA